MKKVNNETTSSKLALLRGIAIFSVFVGLISGGLYVTAVSVNRLVDRVFSEPTEINTTPPTGQKSDFPEEELPAPIEEVVKTLKHRTVDLTSERASVILLYGPIMQNGNTIAELIRNAALDKKPIYLLIDSPGGSVISGGAIVSAIEASSVPVYTVCLQVCASMAAMIHQYGTKRYMVDRSILMFHHASGGFQGSLPQIASLFGTINRFVNKMFLNTAQRSNQSLKDFLQKIEHDLWIDAEDSVSQRYSDETVNVVYQESEALNPPTFFTQQQRIEFKEKLNLSDIK